MSTTTTIDARVILDTIENWMEERQTASFEQSCAGTLEFLDARTEQRKAASFEMHRGMPHQLLIRVNGTPFRITVTEGGAT